MPFNKLNLFFFGPPNIYSLSGRPISFLSKAICRLFYHGLFDICLEPTELDSILVHSTSFLSRATRRLFNPGEPVIYFLRAIRYLFSLESPNLYSIQRQPMSILSRAIQHQFCPVLPDIYSIMAYPMSVLWAIRCLFHAGPPGIYSITPHPITIRSRATRPLSILSWATRHLFYPGPFGHVFMGNPISIGEFIVM